MHSNTILKFLSDTIYDKKYSIQKSTGWVSLQKKYGVGNKLEVVDKLIADYEIKIDKIRAGEYNLYQINKELDEDLKEYIISENEIPQSYWDNKVEQMINEGRAFDINYYNITTFKTDDGIKHYKFPRSMKLEEIRVIQKKQLDSLSLWIEYLKSKDTDIYPTWLKIWAYNSIFNLGIYDKKLKNFSKRTKTTTAPFPVLNREALALTFSGINSFLSNENIDENLKTLLSTKNFGKIYGYYLSILPVYSENNLENTEGIWIKYKHDTKKDGKEALKLVKSLEGYTHGWCTGSLETASLQLESGDFYVYYSTNQETNQPTVPRVTIRMSNYKIVEIRGIAKNQNLDPYIGGVVDKKLKKFGKEGERYTKASNDMQKLTAIFNKNKNKEKLTKEELKFIYEIENEIEGFGYSKDPRVDEIIEDRKLQGILKQELSDITGIKVEFISISSDEFKNRVTKFHYGDLDLSEIKSAKGLELPNKIVGSLFMSKLTDAKGLKLSTEIKSDIAFYKLKSANGLEFPTKIGGTIYLSTLTDPKGIIFPKTVLGGVHLPKIKSAKRLVLPETIGKYINLSGLKSAKGLVLPKTFEGWFIDLSGLKSAKGLIFPETLGGEINLSGLKSAVGIVFPKTIKGRLDLSRLKSIKGLKLPEEVSQEILLNNLTSAKGLKFPEKVVGGISLKRLKSHVGLTLPKKINKYLLLDGLKSAIGLTLPEEVKGVLSLDGLKSIKGLNFPEKFVGGISLNGLKSAKDLVLPKKISEDLYLEGLTSAINLHLPEEVGYDIKLSRLKSIKGLILPKKIGRDLDLSGLIDADGLNLNIDVGREINLSGLKSTNNLVFPQYTKFGLNLSGIVSTSGLVLPEEINGNLDLSGLRSADGLKLPRKINGNLHLNKLKYANDLVFPEQINGDLNLRNLKKAKNFKLPQYINKGYLFMQSLKSAEGLMFPKYIEFGLDLSSLKTAKGLTLPEEVGWELRLERLESIEGLKLPKIIGGNLIISKITSNNLLNFLIDNYQSGNSKIGENIVLNKKFNNKNFKNKLDNLSLKYEFIG